MKIITNSHDTDQRLAGLFVGWVVGVKANDGRAFDMRVDTVATDGFVSIEGPLCNGDGFPVDRTHTSIALIDIDTLEAY